MRTVSLLPAATEIMGALGLMDQVVGVSHECNYPEEANHRPRVTNCEIHGNQYSSREIDQWVSRTLGQGEDLFRLDEKTLREIEPELILTQHLCDVCAPAYGSVTALARTLPGPPRVLNLEPSRLQDILDNIQQVADTVDAAEAGRRLIQQLDERISRVRQQAEPASRKPRVAVLEWLDPVYCSGHWTPELVEIAGGQEVLGMKWQDSICKAWSDVLHARADIVVIACCGYSAARALRDWRQVQDHPDIQDLPAVQKGRVYLADGNAYFSRPGPRLVDTLEILAEIIHPEIFAGQFPDRGVVPWPKK